MRCFALTYEPSGSKDRKVFIQNSGQYCIYQTYAEAAFHLGKILPRLDRKEWSQEVINSARVTEIIAKKAE